MVEQIESFEPVQGTNTHVLVDSWFTCKAVWKAARQRGFGLTGGLKANRSVRVEDPDGEHGWRWQPLPEYAAGIREEDYVQVCWPRARGEGLMSVSVRGGTEMRDTEQADAGEGRRMVYVHVITTRVRKLYRCQLLVVRESLGAPLSEARYWTSSDLEASVEQLLRHVAARWDIEVLFADCKELLGLDQYQLMSATSIERFWTLTLAAYTLLDEQRACLQAGTSQHVTIGDARREIQRVHRRHLLDWLHQQFVDGVPQEHLYDLLAA